MKVYNIDQEKELLTELIKELEERIERQRKEKQRGWGLIVAEFEAYKKTLESKLSKLQINEKN